MLLDPVIAAKKIDFTVEVQGDCVIETYAGESRQVLLNIVRNACESITRQGAKVTVNLKGEPDQVEVVVADEGAGIAPEVITRLFEFGLSTKGEQGNGMGLWTVKRILDSHGGNVNVRSSPGSGTEFSLHWPRVWRTR